MPALSVIGGVDTLSNQLRFEILVAADADTQITPDLDALGSAWTNLNVDFTSGQVTQHSTADIDLKFGVGLAEPAGVNPFFNLTTFDISTSIELTTPGANTFGFTIGDGVVTGNINATTLAIDAGVNIAMGGAGSLEDRIAVTPHISNPLNIDLLFDAPSLFGSTIVDARAKFTDNDVLDETPAVLDLSDLASLDLNVSAQPMIDGLETLADWIDIAIINDPQLATKLPLVNRSLAEVLAASAVSREFSGAAITNITSPVVVGQSQQFTATLNASAAAQGIKRGDTARFLATTGDHFTAEVVAVSGHSLTLSYAATRHDCAEHHQPITRF